MGLFGKSWTWKKQPTAAERRSARRAARTQTAKEKTAGLPDALESPFFDELAAEWPNEPTLKTPVSQMCTASQFDEPDYARICEIFDIRPRLQRKQWEFVFIYRAIEAAGLIEPGRRGIAFGVGRERMPSVLSKRKVDVVATDLPVQEANGYWVKSNQHANSVETLYRQNLTEREDFDRHVSFRPVNMKSIPADLRGFDFCWSACALEHLGDLEAGFDFIRASLDTLKPGGVAAHTTEFNLGSDETTLESGSTVVYRRSDILRLTEELRADGHTVSVNLSPGRTPTDRMIDRLRTTEIHLRLYVKHQIPATSIGLIVRKAA